MLVGKRRDLVAGRRRLALWLGVAMVVVPMLSLALYLSSGTEVARARNALVLDEQADANIDWSPPNIPPDFLVDRVVPDPMLVEVARRLRLAELPTDWERALAISRQLLGSGPSRRGGAIQSDLRTTYRRITGDSEGYCVDFVQVFSAIAAAAGMPMRSWASSFDGFGGHDHIPPRYGIARPGRGSWWVCYTTSISPVRVKCYLPASSAPRCRVRAAIL